MSRRQVAILRRGHMARRPAPAFRALVIELVNENQDQLLVPFSI